ncbi:MAG TPA: RNA polymerase sigma-54 factor, partial [Sphingomonas sp.]|nr:RNA polymerase sigma-54 factor [Sphingomonas sp.]
MASLAPRLDLRQSQSLVMTPQLQQAIKLLALSNLEIEAFIAEELDKNPLLETGGEEAVRVDPPEADAGEWDGEDAPEPVTADRLVEHGDGVADAPLDVDFVSETFHHDGPTDSYGLDGASGLGAAGASSSEDAIDLDGFAGAAGTLQDHLLAQAGACLSGRDAVVAAQIIGQLDDAGYLTGELGEIAERL